MAKDDKKTADIAALDLRTGAAAARTDRPAAGKRPSRRSKTRSRSTNAARRSKPIARRNCATPKPASRKSSSAPAARPRPCPSIKTERLNHGDCPHRTSLERSRHLHGRGLGRTAARTLGPPGARDRGHALRDARRRQARPRVPGAAVGPPVRRRPAGARRASPAPSNAFTPIRWPTTTCPRWTTTTCAAASPRPTRSSTKRPPSSPATRC